MDTDRETRLARKAFLGTTALAASAAVLAGCRTSGSVGRDHQLGSIVYPVLTPDQYDYAAMMATFRVRARHKQLFPATTAAVQQNGASVLYQHMQFGMNNFEFSLPHGPEKLATLGVLSGSAVTFALNDDMWRTYEIGKRFSLAEANVYYRASSNLDLKAAPNDPKGIYQDWSAQAVLKRGGTFMVCHNAMTYFATDCAIRHQKNPHDVMTEWMANLLPGFLIVPSGIMAMQLAAENGWEIYPAG